MVNSNRKDWARKLGAYRIVFKMPIGTSSYQLVYGMACHLLVELEQKGYWVVKALNFDLKTVGEKKSLQLNEFEEFHQQAYENAKLYKEKTKL